MEEFISLSFMDSATTSNEKKLKKILFVEKRSFSIKFGFKKKRQKNSI
jgi:hypothetical protein